MINDIEVKLTKQEVQAIITALKNVPYGKCNFGGKEELIEKLKGKSNCMYRNKYDTTKSDFNEEKNTELEIKKYIVKDNLANRIFTVEHWGEISLDTVWQSISHFFFLGANVTITNESGETRTYIK